MPFEGARPFVAMAVGAACDPALGAEALWGLEEEGVPGLLLPAGRDDPSPGLMAARSSPLGLGIALDACGGVLWHAGIPGRPLLRIGPPLTADGARRLGGAAGRLAKRIPLRLGSCPGCLVHPCD